MPLYAIDDFDNLPVLELTAAQDENYAQRVPNTKPSEDDSECDHQTTVETVHAQ